MNQVAIVTGAYRGLGLAACRELAKKEIHVILTSRNVEKGLKAVETLNQEGLKNVHYHPLDVTKAESIQKLYDHVLTLGHLDILINNAGIFPTRPNEGTQTAFVATVDSIRNGFETNTVGPFLMCQKFIPLMKKNNNGRVVNVSSGMGQLSEMATGYPGYRLSKTALNAVTRIFSEEVKGTNILVNSVCPGWVRTEMGGPNATRSIEEGVDSIVWLATLPNDGPTGGFFRDRKQIAW